ncbi:response regulator transcription factor [Ramlibacter solisilvae]|uniref:LuxR family transcriptional regulator n=1 Tax=Ramlibacter tataouinensis TaxID=94132 RepID=UPI0007773E06|nr:response regulator transcription factor [Ramlibacter tataouinensis]
MQIELLFAGADAGVRAAAVNMLACEGDELRIKVVDFEEAASAAASQQPDVLLLERCEWTQTLALLTQIGIASPRTRSLLLCDGCASERLIDALRHHSWGCVIKPVEPQTLAKAVRTVHQGGTWYGRGVLLQALQAQLGLIGASGAAEEGKLTRREEEILRLIGQGMTNKEIGRVLDISDQTVKTHLHRVYAKLHQSGRYKAFLAKPGSRQAHLGPA